MSDHCPTCKTFAKENEAQSHEIVGYQAEILHLVREKNALKRELSNLRRIDPTSTDIMGCLRLWRAVCVAPKSRSRVSIDIDGDRAKVVRRALKVLTVGDRKDRRRLCMDAIRGKALRPYEAFGQWHADPGERRKRRNDVEHALGSERRIEEHAAYWRATRMSEAEKLRALWGTAQHYADQQLRALTMADRSARYARRQPWPNGSDIPPWMSDAMLRVLDRQIGSRVMDSEIKVLALMCCLTAEHACYEHEFRDLHPDAPTITELAAPDDRPTLFVIDGGKEQAA